MNITEPIPGATPKDIVVQQPSHIGDLIRAKLAEREIPVPKIEAAGANALLGTNETVADGFLENLWEQAPDGYFIGIGIGHALAFMPQLYVEAQLPRGVILADIDPRVVAVGKMLFEDIASSQDVGTFIKQFFEQSEEDFLVKLQSLKRSFPESLRSQVDSLEESKWRDVYKGIQNDVRISHALKSPFQEGVPTDVIFALKNPQVFQFYKRLVEDGNITIEYTDFTNQDFIQAVRELPNFTSSRNVIYTSNIVDHITHRGTVLDNLKIMDNLRQLEDADYIPIFIDALQANNYYLRATDGLPTYSARDLKRTFTNWKDKPNGLLFNPQAVDLEHVNIKVLPDKVLKRYYEKFLKSDTAKMLAAVAKKYFNLGNITNEGSIFYMSAQRSFLRSRFKEMESGDYGEEGRKHAEKQKQKEALEHPLYSRFIWGDEFVQFTAFYTQMKERGLL